MNPDQIGNRIRAFIKNEKWTLIILAAALAVFAFMRIRLGSESTGTSGEGDYAEYEKGRITEILSDTSEADESSDGGYRGEQMLVAVLETGQYKGTSIMAYNYIGPLYGVPLKTGDTASFIVNTYASGDIRATVFEFNRAPAIIGILAAFFLITVLIGGRKGLQSLIALTVTVICLFTGLIPYLLKGAPTLPAVFITCLYITVVSFLIIGGLHRKSIAAMAGTAAGTALAMLFGLAAQHFARVDGLRLSDVEPLLQLRQSGVPIGLRGLLVGGIIISSLGAVMDVSMSISSALEEVHAANPSYTMKDLFASGMNIGRDMAGTMTNTLILAFLGSGFTLILYLFSLGLTYWQIMPSAYAATEVVSSVSSSIGMILAIPLTAFISAWLISLEHQK